LDLTDSQRSQLTGALKDAADVVIHDTKNMREILATLPL
jgi:hypothetical protein